MSQVVKSGQTIGMMMACIQDCTAVYICTHMRCIQAVHMPMHGGSSRSRDSQTTSLHRFQHQKPDCMHNQLFVKRSTYNVYTYENAFVNKLMHNQIAYRKG